MPTYHDLVQVARSLKREIDAEGKAFKSLARLELTQRLRTSSGAATTRIKSSLGADLEQALSDQGLRCYPSLTETTTGDWVRIFRAGSVASDLIDAVTVPSAEHDRAFAEAVAKFKGKWDWAGGPQSHEPTVSTVVRQVLPREKHMAYVRSLDDDPDLATT